MTPTRRYGCSFIQAVIIFLVLLVFGCRSIKVSEYARYNKFENDSQFHVTNDSLKYVLSYGHNLTYKKIEDELLYKIDKNQNKVLKKIGLRKQAALVAKYSQGFRKIPLSQNTYIISSKYFYKLNNFITLQRTDNKDSFFTLKKIITRRGNLMTLTGIKLDNKYVLFSIYQYMKDTFKLMGDPPSYLVINAESGFKTILKGENYLNLKLAKEKLINIIGRCFNDHNNYYEPIITLNNLLFDSVQDFNLSSRYIQSLMLRESYFDNLVKIKNVKDKFAGYLTRENKSNKNNLDKRIDSVGADAISYISTIAQQQKILLFNESHYDYRHRLLITLLLDSLYKLGYRHLAMEAKIYNKEKEFVSKQDAFYILEPFLANLIREARQKGFSIDPYDDTSGYSNKFISSVDQREHNQGKNLADLFHKDSSAKWVVLAGYSHINKNYFTPNQKSAAQYFKEFSGIEPYSINQSDYTDILFPGKLNFSDKPPGYYMLDFTSTVYKDRQADLYIVNNIKENPYEKPFYSIMPKLTKYEIDYSEKLTLNSEVFIFIKKELSVLKNNALPIYIGHPQKGDSIFLPKNEYQLLIVDDKDVIKQTGSIN